VIDYLTQVKRRVDDRRQHADAHALTYLDQMPKVITFRRSLVYQLVSEKGVGVWVSEVLSWTVVITILIGLGAIAFAAMATKPPWYRSAQAAFVGIALVADAKIIFWAITSPQYGLDARVLVSIIILLVVNVGVAGYVYNIEQQRRDDQRPSKQWYETPESDLVKGVWLSSPEPNIVCLGEGDLFLRLDNQNIFRDAGYGESELRAIAPKFANEPKIQDREKVGSAHKVRARVIFYEPDWPDKEYLRIDHACWLDEKSPYINLELDGVAYIIAGVFESAPNEDGYQKFTIYGNHPTKTGAQPLMTIPFSAVGRFEYRIKIWLIVGEHGEFSSEHDFELQAQGSAYSFGYIDEKEKALRIESNKIELKRLIERGDKIFNSPLVNVDWDKIYSEIHVWSADAYRFVRQRWGLQASDPLRSSVGLRKYPHKGAERHQQFFDEHYSHFLGLQEIGKAQGAPFTTTSDADVEKDRTRKIVADLLAFSDEGKELLQQTLTGYNNAMRMIIMRWEDRVYDYLESHFDKNDAISFIDDTNFVSYTLPEGSRVLQRDLIDRIHTRLTRIDEVIRRITK
jgi:hypothetical protein